MGAEAQAAATTTTTQAPAPKTGRDAAIELVGKTRVPDVSQKDEKTNTSTEPVKPADTKTEPEKAKVTLDKPEEPRPSHELAVIARANKKILEERAAMKREQAAFDGKVKELEQKAKDLEADLKLAAKIKAKDFTALKDVDEKWYELATKQEIASRKPDSTEALALKMEEKLGSLVKEIEALKGGKKDEPKEEAETTETPPDPRVVKARIAAYKSEVTEHVKTIDTFKGEYEGKPIDPAEVAEEAVTWADAVIIAKQKKAIERGKKYEPTQDEVNRLVIEGISKLATKISEKKKQPSSETSNNVTAATAPKGSESGTADPQQITTRSKPTTETLSDGVSVSAGPRTPEQRRKEAIEFLRRQREQSEG